MRQLCVAFLLMLGLGLASVHVHASEVLVEYLGPHPLAPGVGKGMCHIEGPHLHAYAPHKPMLYVKVGGGWSFVGDPVEFEPAAPRHAYYGHHPVFWTHEGGSEPEHYCYISGPHHHWYPPPPEARFKLKGGAYWFVGAHPAWYRARSRRHRHIDRYYATVSYERPVVVVEPPAGFVGVVVGPGVPRGRAHGHVRGGLYVGAPHVEVNVPVPTFGVTFGAHPPPPLGRVEVRHRVRVVGGGHHVHVRGGKHGHGPVPGKGKGKGKGKGR